jgi:hypothetical protein
MTVFVGSWNVGNSCPPDNLSPWITGGAYDIVVVGAQVFRPFTLQLFSVFFRNAVIRELEPMPAIGLKELRDNSVLV